MNYDWAFGRLAKYADAFFVGALTTIELSILVIVLGTVGGFALGLVLRSPVLGRTIYPFLDVIRAVPPLVLLLFFYYALTVDIIGTSVGGFWVYVIAMTINLSAFMADLVRSNLESIDRDTIDSGRALGLNNRQVFTGIVFPKLLRSLIAPAVSLYIGMIKLSSLASIINVSEVVYVAQSVIADISRSLEAWVVVACIYIVIVLPLAYGLRALERLSRRGMNAVVVV